MAWQNLGLANAGGLRGAQVALETLRQQALAEEARRLAEAERQFENDLALRKQGEVERSARVGEGFEGKRLTLDETRVGYEGDRVGLARNADARAQGAFDVAQDDRRGMIDFLSKIDDPNLQQAGNAQRFGLTMGRADFLSPIERGTEQGQQAAAAFGAGGRDVLQGQTDIQTRGAININNARQAAAAPSADPQVAALADSILKNPDLLKEIPPSGRQAVLSHIAASGGEMPNKRRESVRTMVDGARRALEQLKGGRGFAGAVGAPALTDPGSWPRAIGMGPMPGSASAGYGQFIDALKANLALPKLEFMRGLGAMSDREFRAITAAVSALDPSMPEDVFRRELGVIESTLNQMEAATGGGGASGGGGADPLGLRGGG